MRLCDKLGRHSPNGRIFRLCEEGRFRTAYASATLVSMSLSPLFSPPKQQFSGSVGFYEQTVFVYSVLIIFSGVAAVARLQRGEHVRAVPGQPDVPARVHVPHHPAAARLHAQRRAGKCAFHFPFLPPLFEGVFSVGTRQEFRMNLFLLFVVICCNWVSFGFEVWLRQGFFSGPS